MLLGVRADCLGKILTPKKMGDSALHLELLLRREKDLRSDKQTADVGVA